MGDDMTNCDECKNPIENCDCLEVQEPYSEDISEASDYING